MTDIDRDIDSAVRDAVAGEVGRERFDFWFGDSVQLHLADRSLLISAADQFTLDRLQSQFRRELSSAASSLVGDTVDVHFRLDATLAAADDALTIAGTIPLRGDGGGDGGSSGGALGMASARGSSAGPEKGKELPSGKRRFARLGDFIVGTGNRLAYTAAQMVVERPGSVSPLFLFGPTGCGKTHLLEGIWSAVRSAHSQRRVLYLTAEQFTSMFLEALQGSGLPSFRHKYRHVDVLLIDDVQFFLGKRATLVELQSTIDSLLREQRQLVLAADRSPAELSRFGPELTARFAGGLVCNLEPADGETRLQLLRQLADRMGAMIPEDVLQLMASRLDGDARKLTGALHQLLATSRAFNREVDLPLAHSTLVDVFRATQRVVQLDDIDRAVCDVFGLEPRSLQSSCKARAFSQPRALAMWLARQHTRAAFAEIGEYFGNRSHSTVISAQKQVSRWMGAGQPVQLAHCDCNIQEAIRRVESQIRTG